MAKNLIEGGPSEGELVVAVVREVKQNGAYVDIDEYDGIEGFIFIGEIASGWIKNIRAFVRPGQRLICKVLRKRKDNKSLELSLKCGDNVSSIDLTTSLIDIDLKSISKLLANCLASSLL